MKLPRYHTSNSSYGYYHDFWRRSSLLQLPSYVKNRELDRLRQSTRTSSELYGAFYHMDTDRWANPNVPPPATSDPGAEDSRHGRETNEQTNEDTNRDAQRPSDGRHFLPPIVSSQRLRVDKYDAPKSYESINLPDIREVELNFTLNDASRITLHAVPKTPKSIYQTSYA